MACGRRRRREDGGVDPDMATGPRLESPHFFKIILSDTLESGKLGIPKKFLGRYGMDLSSLVLLKVPGSSTWTIGVAKSNNGTVWLWKGWREFMQHYSIGHGHLVVFKYKGNSAFRVIIFDKSASEINYSLSSISNLRSGFISPKREDIVEVEDSEDFAPCQKMRVKPHSPCSQPSPSCSSQDLEEGIGRSRCRASHPEPNFGGPMSSWPLRSFELASEFDSEYPFFKVVIRPSYNGHHVVNVPRGFITQHIQEIKEIVTLRHSNRTWPVKLRSYPSGLMQFSSGWIAFVRGTGLHAGNVCVFELIDRDDIVFRVYIFSSAGRKKQSKCRMNHLEPVFYDPTASRPLPTPELASKFDSEHPFFKLHVPGQFAEQHIQKNKRKGTLRYSERSWPVNLSRYTQGTRVFFSAGWPAFARETHMRVGNACVFELIDRDDVVFKVSIFSSGGRYKRSKCRVNNLEPVFHDPAPPRPLATPELAREFDSEHPFFKLVIRQGHLKKLGVPDRFIRQHIQENKGTATLRYSDRSWPVKLLTCKNKKGALFSAGWTAFARETHLRVGNACTFELIDWEDNVFKVSIFR
ncbi:B3 domain-containing transcription factor VRN1-like isoform X2 [Syzygium oleosum]|uniref:B3 domain-containing transcription factor VRN1-like isoform X2 n=1 Tax=Syzygium oleosum TaxID=219896 RepID=UPI0024BB8F9C|nr:B3 domain-containing transcription factor VRN1-like isoform X2 [Syzygium oleosum]